jgi:hypothetical protein
MWLFTKYGMFSAVCARTSGDLKAPVDPKLIQVRARVKEHLLNLKREFPQLRRCKIKTYAASDYAFRIYVAKKVWVGVIAELAEDVDYDNFKSAVAQYQGRNDYEQALHRVWSVMYGLQPRRELPPASPPPTTKNEFGRYDPWFNQFKRAEEERSMDYLRYHTERIHRENN